MLCQTKCHLETSAARCSFLYIAASSLWRPSITERQFEEGQGSESVDRLMLHFKDFTEVHFIICKLIFRPSPLMISRFGVLVLLLVLFWRFPPYVLCFVLHFLSLWGFFFPTFVIGLMSSTCSWLVVSVFSLSLFTSGINVPDDRLSCQRSICKKKKK